MTILTIEQIDAVLPQKQSPVRQAVIREADCIGCTKCIKACPFDSIVGAAKQMHTVISDACTGCELCVAPCPVDCIDMVVIEQQWHENDLAEHLPQWRMRYQARKTRLQQNRSINPKQTAAQQSVGTKTMAERKADIAAAVARVKAKKHE